MMCSLTSFRARRSCESQLISLTLRASRTPWEEITDWFNYTRFLQGLRHGPQSGRIKWKMWKLGIQGTTHRRINAFLADRLQRVIVDGEASDLPVVESGVPQGTVLGPIIFHSFIDDLPLAVQGCGVRRFGDECPLSPSFFSGWLWSSPDRSLQSWGMGAKVV